MFFLYQQSNTNGHSKTISDGSFSPTWWIDYIYSWSLAQGKFFPLSSLSHSHLTDAIKCSIKTGYIARATWRTHILPKPTRAQINRLSTLRSGKMVVSARTISKSYENCIKRNFVWFSGADVLFKTFITYRRTTSSEFLTNQILARHAYLNNNNFVKKNVCVYCLLLIAVCIVSAIHVSIYVCRAHVQNNNKHQTWK